MHTQTTLSCRASPLSSLWSEGGKDEDPIHLDCEWYNLCSNDSVAEVTTNYINCSIPESASKYISDSRSCHVWGSDGSDQEMLFIYLLKITPENLILYYFNNSYGSQQYPFNLTPRQQLCTPSSNLDIGKVINESCMSRESIPTVLPNMDSLCCSDSNVNISFNGSERMMEITFLHGSIEIPVEYLDCTRKFYKKHCGHLSIAFLLFIHTCREADDNCYNTIHYQYLFKHFKHHFSTYKSFP